MKRIGTQLLLCLLVTTSSYAQPEAADLIAKDPDTLSVSSVLYGDNAPSSSSPKAIALQEGYSLPHSTLVPMMPLAAVEGSERFQQEYKGIPFFASQMIVNRKSDGSISSTVFKVSEAIPETTTPSLSAEGAKTALLKNYPSEIAAALHISEPTLVFFDPHLAKNAKYSGAILGWKMVAESTVGPIHDTVVIDAKTGELLHSSTDVQSISRYVFDCSFGNGNCYVDAFYAPYNYYYGRSEGQPARGPNPRFGIDPFFDGYPLEVDNLYDRLLDVYNYYKEVHAREGADGAGGIGNDAFLSYTRAGTYAYSSLSNGFAQNCPNAFFSFSSGGYLSFCKGFAVYDVVGHEYTHAVVRYSVLPEGLIYENDSGALNEAFADIFGEAVERKALGTNDWITGGTSILPLRNLVDPESASYPATKYSANFYCGTADHGGVHTNSSVFAFAAKLLATGGTNNGCTINAITSDKQERIFYRALTAHMTSSATFQDAYNGVLASCVELYGITSDECRETAKALNAAMLNQPGRCTTTPAAAVDCDNCPLDSAKAEPGTCGCGVADTDTDADGTKDCLDQCTSDPLKVAPGTCGCGVADADLNNDRIIDCAGVRTFVKNIQPLLGAATVSGRSFTLLLEKMLGKDLSYEVTVKGPKKFKKIVHSKSNKISIKGLTATGNYTVKFKIMQTPKKGGKPVSSKLSASSSVTV